MYINNISTTWQDYPDDTSIAVIVFFEGCIHNCKGCQNPQLQTPNPVDKISVEMVLDRIKVLCKKNDTNKIVFSGGDPLYDENLSATKYLIKNLTNYDICVYTGYDIENSIKRLSPITPLWLKCGTYIENLKEDNWGKTNEELTLATKNQGFYIYDSADYIKISNNNHLMFKSTN